MFGGFKVKLLALLGRLWIRSLRIRLNVPEGFGPGILGIRVDDRNGNPPYDDRWQTEVDVTNGWNVLVLDRDWLITPGGREMDRQGIRTWGVFVVDSPKTNYFGLAKARLLVD